MFFFRYFSESKWYFLTFYWLKYFVVVKSCTTKKMWVQEFNDPFLIFSRYIYMFYQNYNLKPRVCLLFLSNFIVIFTFRFGSIEHMLYCVIIHCYTFWHNILCTFEDSKVVFGYIGYIVADCTLLKVGK